MLGSSLKAGQRLLPGETLSSASARLTMQADGNLVIASKSGKALWSAGTSEAGATALLDAGGNLVVRNAADTANLWEAKTSAAGGYRRTHRPWQPDGARLAGASQWSSGTVVR